MERMILALIEEYPGISLARLCASLNEQYVYGASDAPKSGYAPGAKKVRKHLQRLRKNGAIENHGQRWYIKKESES